MWRNYTITSRARLNDKPPLWRPSVPSRCSFDLRRLSVCINCTRSGLVARGQDSMSSIARIWHSQTPIIGWIYSAGKRSLSCNKLGGNPTHSGKKCATRNDCTSFPGISTADGARIIRDVRCAKKITSLSLIDVGKARLIERPLLLLLVLSLYKERFKYYNKL